MIRVVIFADSLARAESFANLLAEDERLEVVETRVWVDSVRWSEIAVADVVLAVAVRLPERVEGPPIVLVTSDPPGRGPFLRAIRAWLPEHSSPAEFAAAIVAAAQDLTVLTQEQARDWLKGADAIDSDEPAIEALTSRERQVLRMMADGLANKEIAAELKISRHTAKFHVAQILAKLGAGSRAEAVSIGIRRGLLPI